MFNNPGTKIKNLAKTFFWIEMIGVIAAILAMGDDLFEEPIIAIAVLVGGFCVAYISALFLAAFGELVETNTQIKESNEAILNLMNTQKQEPAVVPVSPSAKPAGAQTPFLTYSDGSWQCTCGRKNMSYVSTCSCGKNKRDLQ